MQDGDYVSLVPDEDGILRSQIFSWLWLKTTALLQHDMTQFLAVLQAGLNSTEHQAFVEELAGV